MVPHTSPSLLRMYRKEVHQMKHAAIVKVKETHVLHGERMITFYVAPKKYRGIGAEGWDLWSQVGDGKLKKHTRGNSCCPGTLDDVIEQLKHPLNTEWSTFDIIQIQKL